MSAIDEILMLLKDGKWHDLKEISEKFTLPKAKAEMAVSFLSEYDFVKQSEDTKVKLHSTLLKFIETTQRLGNEDV